MTYRSNCGPGCAGCAAVREYHALDLSLFGSLPAPSPENLRLIGIDWGFAPVDPDLHWQLLPQYLRDLSAERVPNRLFGVKINREGDAI